MHDRYILPLDVVDHNLPNLCVLASVPEEEQISPLKGRLHASGKNYYYRRRRVCSYGEALPQHESCRENKGEIQDLGEGLSGVAQSGEHDARRLGRTER